MNFKNIATAALIAASVLCVADAVAPKKAEARTCFKVNQGAALCSKYIGKNEAGSKLYNVGYVQGNKEVAFRVACRGNYARNWESYGNLSHGQVEALAQYFCRLPG